MNIDIRVDTTWRNHKKRWRVYDVAGNDGVQAIQDLWLYAATYCPNDGILRDMDERDIVRAAQYTGGKDIIAILVTEKFLDKIKEGRKTVYQLHNWKLRQGYLCGSNERSKIARNAAKIKWRKVKEAMLPGCSEHAGSNAEKILSNAPSPAPNPLPNPTPKAFNEPRPQAASTGLSTDFTRKGLQSVQDVFLRIGARQKTQAGAK